MPSKGLRLSLAPSSPLSLRGGWRALREETRARLRVGRGLAALKLLFSALRGGEVNDLLVAGLQAGPPRGGEEIVAEPEAGRKEE